MKRLSGDQQAFHVTPAKFIPSILMHGLRPFIGDRSARKGEQSPGIYLFTDRDSVETALLNWLGDELESDYGDDVDLTIIEIDVGNLYATSDVGYEICIDETITASRINNFYTAEWELRELALNESPIPIHIIGNTAARRPDGAPYLVYRGEHGLDIQEVVTGLQTKLPMITFSNIDTAEVYAASPNDSGLFEFEELAPRIYAGYLSITKPIIDNRDDPFFELHVIEEAFGRDTAVAQAKEYGSYIEMTNNWCEIRQSTGFYSVDDYLAVFPDRVGQLYFDAYHILDNESFVQLITPVGFDGAIHLGNGESAAEEEYKIMSEHQFISLISPDSSLSPESVLFRRVLSAKQEIVADIEKRILPKTVSSFSELHDYVDANMYVNDADKTDNLIGLLGKKLGWQHQNYVEFTNRIITEVDTWLESGVLLDHPYFTKPSTDALYLNIVANTESAAFADLGERYELLRSLDAARLVLAMSDKQEVQLLDTNGNVFGAVSISNSSQPDTENMNFHLAINMNLAVIDQSRAAYLMEKVIEEWSDDEPGFTNGESGTFELFGKEVGVLNIIKAREPEHRLEYSADMESASAGL